MYTLIINDDISISISQFFTSIKHIRDSSILKYELQIDMPFVNMENYKYLFDIENIKIVISNDENEFIFEGYQVVRLISDSEEETSSIILQKQE